MKFSCRITKQQLMSFKNGVFNTEKCVALRSLTTSIMRYSFSHFNVFVRHL